MLVNIYYFPKMWLEPLNEVLKQEDFQISVAVEYPREDSQFTEITFECNGNEDILMLGYRLCFYEMNKTITEKAFPKMLENLDKLITKVTEHSNN